MMEEKWNNEQMRRQNGRIKKQRDRMGDQWKNIKLRGQNGRQMEKI